MNSRYTETLDQRLEIGLSKPLKVKVNEVTKRIFPVDYEAGSNRSEMVRTSLEVFLDLIDQWEEEEDVEGMSARSRKYKLKKWLEDEVLKDRILGGREAREKC